MRLHGSRLFVGGLAPGTGGYFRCYGEVGQIWLPQPLPCRPRLFAFVQFVNPSDAGRVLADAHHVINGPVHIGRARCKEQIYYKPLSLRIFWCGNCCHRVGDIMTICMGLSDPGNDYVNQVRPFSTMAHGMLFFDCVIGYISEDGKECLVRWPPVQQSDAAAAMSGQGKIVLACDCPLKDLAQD